MGQKRMFAKEFIKVYGYRFVPQSLQSLLQGIVLQNSAIVCLQRSGCNSYFHYLILFILFLIFRQTG